MYKEDTFPTTYAEIGFINSFQTINTKVVEKNSSVIKYHT